MKGSQRWDKKKHEEKSRDSLLKETVRRIRVFKVNFEKSNSTPDDNSSNSSADTMIYKLSRVFKCRRLGFGSLLSCEGLIYHCLLQVYQCHFSLKTKNKN